LGWIKIVPFTGVDTRYWVALNPGLGFWFLVFDPSHGTARHGTAWHGMAWHDMTWYGMVSCKGEFYKQWTSNMRNKSSIHVRGKWIRSDR
jgi:hypothetical protein